VRFGGGGGIDADQNGKPSAWGRVASVNAPAKAIFQPVPKDNGRTDNSDGRRFVALSALSVWGQAHRGIARDAALGDALALRMRGEQIMLHWRAAITSERRPSDPGNALSAIGLAAGFSRKFPRNTEIFSGHELEDRLFKVVSGSVRIVKLMASGRRQIVAFWFPGDVFGLEAGDSQCCSAEAIADSEIVVGARAFAPRGALTPERILQLWEETLAQLHRANNHLLLLGQKNAEERVATFLLEMDARPLSRAGFIELPMCRQDIADYLGLTIETVSRTLTQLERMQIITMPSSRRIGIFDRAALEDLSEGVGDLLRHH
jgi:CRP/FNR family nitrogen fixation transcriptional regulator